MLAVRVDEIGKRGVSGPRIVDVRGEGGSPIGGAEHAGNEARTIGCRARRLRCGFASQTGSGTVQVDDSGLRTVVRLGNAIGVEGIGLDDVRARVEIGFVNRRYDVGARDAQQVVIALEGLRVLGERTATVILFGQVVSLHHGTHRPVENENAIGGSLVQQVGSVRDRHGFARPSGFREQKGPVAGKAPKAGLFSDLFYVAAIRRKSPR